LALEQYRRKRRFDRTPEPSGQKEQSGSGRLYVIQKHAASHLHYDFRLELDGVLKSWAVPKGPSLVPGEKRLAVQVEDHPVEYGSFEGTIPEGEYGGGTVMLWDRGQWEPLGNASRDYEKGHLSFRLAGEKLQGEWTLARMHGKAAGEKGRNWLLIKKKDDAAQDGDITEEQPLSVASGRSLEEIAEAANTIRHPAGDISIDSESKRNERDRPPFKETPVKETPAAIDPARLPHAKRATVSADISPQMAILADEPPEGENWLHEIKYDGYRILAVIKSGKIRLLTRRGKDWAGKFAPVAAALAELSSADAVLDGEVAVLRPDGTTDFQALQNVLEGIGSGQMVYFLFDVPFYGEYDLSAVPLLTRKQFLERLLVGVAPEHPVLRFSDHIQGNGDIVFEQACRLGLEGIVSKRADSAYVQKRTRNWLKVKCLERQEFVIGGYTEPSGSRQGFGALLLGYYNGRSGLVFAGRVGTGFKEKVLADLSGRFQKRERSNPPFANPPTGREAKGVHWIAPELVAEVEFSEWTEDGVLRQPVFKGLREDKEPRKVVRERPQSWSTPESWASGPPARSAAGRVAGIKLTNPERVFYPDMGITKEELAKFYESIGDWVLPRVAGRPLTLLRCPQGHEEDCFYQKHLEEAMPSTLKGVKIEEKEGPEMYVYLDDLPGLVTLVQLGVLEFHPWGARVDKVERPDLMIFDLDPGEGVEWKMVVDGARLLRDRLADLGLESFLKTTGGKGLHVVVPLIRRAGWDEVKDFARAVAEDVARTDHRHYIATMSKSRRREKIYIDYLRNARGATSVAAYSTRARPGAPVSTPIRWDELSESLTSDAYTIHNLSRRLAQLEEDPWAGMGEVRQSITKAMKKEMGIRK
jgi:bifunctional non-homologous end joining protein LigD